MGGEAGRGLACSIQVNGLIGTASQRCPLTVRVGEGWQGGARMEGGGKGGLQGGKLENRGRGKGGTVGGGREV